MRRSRVSPDSRGELESDITNRRTPNPTTTQPATRSARSRLARRADPMAVAPAPRATKTAVNPATKRPVALSILPVPAAPVSSSAIE